MRRAGVRARAAAAGENVSRIQRAGDEKVLVWEPYQYRSTTKTRPSLGFEGGGAKSIGDSAPSRVA